MSGGFVGTLHMTVRRSALNQYMTLVIHVSALAVGAALAIHRPWLIGALPLVVAAGVYSLRHAALRSPRSILRLRWHADGEWVWQTRDGRWQEGERGDAFVLGSLLVIVTLRARGERWWRRRCVLFRDSLDRDTHRRLRARLTIAPRADAAAGDD